jgi:hypothetical protein
MQAARFSGYGLLMCNLYSITTNQEAIIRLFRIMNRYVGKRDPQRGPLVSGHHGTTGTAPPPLTPARHGRNPAFMTTLETAATAEHRCEALTISDIPPYRCTTSATADRRGRAVCASHARAQRIRWFDEHGEAGAKTSPACRPSRV